MAIQSTRLSTTNLTSVYSSAGQQVITVIYICNTSNDTTSVDLYVNNAGNAVSTTANQIYSNLEITGNDTYVISTEKLILDDTGKIEAQASLADKITVTVSSFEV